MRSRVLGNKDDKYGANLSVPIKDIHSFKRMKRFQPYSAVVAALKESKTLEVVGDQEDEIRRKVALEKPAEEDAEFGDPTIPRAIYAKGFGEEGSTTQFDIEAFFTPYGPLNSVRLRRTFPDRHFKGSVFVEFETEELQKEFLAMDPKPKYEGKELLIKSKRQYCDEKLDDVKSGKIRSNKRPLNFK
jgi:lupus La protein